MLEYQQASKHTFKDKWRKSSSLISIATAIIHDLCFSNLIECFGENLCLVSRSKKACGNIMRLELHEEHPF